MAIVCDIEGCVQEAAHLRIDLVALGDETQMQLEGTAFIADLCPDHYARLIAAVEEALEIEPDG